jgi:hypothetical protein
VEEERRWLKWRSLGEDTGIVEKADASRKTVVIVEVARMKWRRLREASAIVTKADASRKTVVIVEVARMMLEVAESWGRLGNR